MLAVLGGHDRVGPVEGVGRGDPDSLDFRVCAELLDGLVGPPAEALLERVAGMGPDIRDSDDLDVRGVAHGGQHAAAGVADANDAELERGPVGHGHTAVDDSRARRSW